MEATWQNRGVRAALASAVLFGAGAPAAKLLLGQTDPWLLAGLLYLGSGLGLGLIRVARRAPRHRTTRSEVLPLIGAIVTGGMLAPVLLMSGLSHTSASVSSLLLNAEGVATAVLAWVVFRENADRRVVLGMIAIVAGAALLTVSGGEVSGSVLPTLAILGACLCWGLDNNFTRAIADADADWLACVKGLAAGSVNLVLALLVGASVPSAPIIGAAMVVGLLAYGVSLVLFIIGLRYVGTARAGAYFSTAPFFGAVLAVVLGDPLTLTMTVAAVLMALGVWLHLTERHEHEHVHPADVHDHWHTHDLHHQHRHDADSPPLRRRGAGQPGHRHRHTHDELVHTHPHFPDTAHRHAH